jgi:hypothetical protein
MDHVEDFTYSILANLTGKYDGSYSKAYLRVYGIVQKNHCGNGYFSWDGIFDDLTDMIGDEDLAREVLRNC